MKSFLLLSLLFGLSLTLALPVIDDDLMGQEELVGFYQYGEVIPGEYVVKARTGANVDMVKELAEMVGANDFWHIKNDVIGDFIGFGGSFQDEQVDFLLQQVNLLEIVEQSQVFRTDAQQLNPPSWGLGATSSPTAQNQGYYNYPDHAGAGVVIYILDTGIRCTHVEFGSRCSWGARFGQGGFNDLNGHGTHVAGTAAGTTYGMAKQATLVAVGVLNPNGNGPTNNIIAGVNYAAAACVLTLGNCVISMSLSGTASATLDAAVNAAVTPTCFVSVSAGNTNIDAGSLSPARAADAYTVMASNAVAKKWASSNWGAVCEIFAPGTSIVSAWNTSDTATNTQSGTSMACPHVSGAAALAFASGHGDPLDRTAIATYINSKALNGVLLNVPAGTVNRFLQVDANF